jgi:hypothetical protein
MTEREELLRAIAKIATFSQVPAANVGQSAKSADDDIGGRRPSGGIDRKDDFQTDFALKSADYFRRCLARCRTERAITELLIEAKATIEAWMHTPIPPGQEPEYGSPQWKRWIAESSEDAGTLARRFNCTRQYIYQIRRGYRDAA